MFDRELLISGIFESMEQGGWLHAPIDTNKYAVFNKVYRDPMGKWEDVYGDYLRFTNWKRIHENAFPLPNGDIVVTIILVVE
jgi:hypothetical protein